jgi:hypothetical protein
MRNIDSKERLHALNLTSLKNRRVRADLIQQFKFGKNLEYISWYPYKNLSIKKFEAKNTDRYQVFAQP